MAVIFVPLECLIAEYHNYYGFHCYWELVHLLLIVHVKCSSSDDLASTPRGIKVSNSAGTPVDSLSSNLKNQAWRIESSFLQLFHTSSFKMQTIVKMMMVLMAVILSVIFAPSDAQMIDPCKEIMITV